jgi:hypothetical protein
MKLDVKLKNCYGIQNLEQSFDFSNNKTFLIYASNGVMKTSFARTFKQIQDGKEPQEEVHKSKSQCKITIDDIDISKDEIFVIKPYVQKYESENISTLLVDDINKDLYEQELKGIVKLKTAFLDKLSKKSEKTKNELEDLILNDFACKDDFFTFLSSITLDNSINGYNDITYAHIFDDKVLKLFEDKKLNLQSNISEYSKKYNEILETIPFFGKNAFNPSGADDVFKALQKGKFFTKENKVKLDGEDVPFSEMELKDRLDKAKEELIKNEQLKKIQESITKNAEVKSFQSLIENKPEIINDLNDLKGLKKKIWNAYFYEYKEDIATLLSSYQEKQSILKSIEDKAILESTKWTNVIKTFKQRFEVPFDIDIKNSKSVILGRDVPNIVFKFKNDGGHFEELNRDKLEVIDVLSQGEKRALYLLNIIFEIESRVERNAKTLFIIDDIADSFDYKNKYAIIEYLKELPHKAPDRFYQIILTHNFDFFRTVQSRFVPFKNAFIAYRNDNAIVMECIEKLGIINPFKNWKERLSKNNKDDKYLLGILPFLRELSEYSNVSNPILHDIMHATEKNKSVTFKDISEIYKNMIGVNIDDSYMSISVFQKFCDISDNILNEANDSDILCLVNKIILSITSRLKAEYYMQKNNIVLEQEIGKTFTKYKNEYKLDQSRQEAIKILEQVVIMTPENIHLNSFMYEPIIDMSDWHLKQLYKNVSDLYSAI